MLKLVDSQPSWASRIENPNLDPPGETSETAETAETVWYGYDVIAS